MSDADRGDVDESDCDRRKKDVRGPKGFHMAQPWRARHEFGAQRSRCAAAEERSDEGTASKRSALAAVGSRAGLGVIALSESRRHCRQA